MKNGFRVAMGARCARTATGLSSVRRGRSHSGANQSRTSWSRSGSALSTSARTCSGTFGSSCSRSSRVSVSERSLGAGWVSSKGLSRFLRVLTPLSNITVRHRPSRSTSRRQTASRACERTAATSGSSAVRATMSDPRGTHDIVMGAGEDAEFDTKNPHWPARRAGRDLRHVRKQGPRMHLRARTPT